MFVIVFLTSCSSGDYSLIGTWEGVNANGDAISMTFEEETVHMTINNGESVEQPYEVDGDELNIGTEYIEFETSGNKLEIEIAGKVLKLKKTSTIKEPETSKEPETTKRLITPYKTKIKGNLGGYLEIAEGEYEIVSKKVYGGWDYYLEFKLVNIKKGSVRKKDRYTIRIYLTDERGKTLNEIESSNIYNNNVSYEEITDPLELLIEDEVGAEEWFVVDFDAPIDSKGTIYDKIKHFKISCNEFPVR